MDLSAIPAITYHFLPQKAGWGWNTGEFFTQPVNFGFGTADISYAGWTAPVDAGPKQEFLQLSTTVRTRWVFNPPTRKSGHYKIVAAPGDKSSDRALYTLDFQPQDHSMPSRALKLWVSLSALENDADWNYKKAVSNIIFKWLVTSQVSGETGLLP